MKKVVLGVVFSVFAVSANAEVVEETIQSNVFDNVYLGLGIGGNFQKSSHMQNRTIGSVVLGGGKTFNQGYVGGEFLLDFCKARKQEYNVNKNGQNIFRKQSLKGMVPQLSIKAGYVVDNSVLVYGKVGCAWAKSTFSFGSDSASKIKTSFVLGLGVEKVFINKFSAALETDYNFGYKWNKELMDQGTKVKETLDDGNISKGLTVRALIKYNVKY